MEAGGLAGPWPTPEPVTLDGAYARLDPLAARHGDALFAASHGDEAARAVWTFLSVGPFADRTAYDVWLKPASASADPLYFAVVDRASGEAAGQAALLRVVPAMGVAEIGHIWFAPGLQRTTAATEALFLLMRHVLGTLRYRRLEWKCDARNAASRRAAERLGFRFEGVFRQHMIVKGRNRDTAWYALLDHEWPAVEAAFTAWLSPANFDADGRQRAPLAAFMPRVTGENP